MRDLPICPAGHRRRVRAGGRRDVARAASARSPDAPAAARGREHPDHARGRRGHREAGHALLDRQGQRGDAAPGDEGVRPRQAAVPADARRHDLEVPRHVRVPRSHGGGSRLRPARAHEPGRGRARHQSLHARIGRAHRHLEDRGAEAGAHEVRVRRRLRRRAPRRGEVARQGARVLVPLRAAPLGSEEPAPGAVAALQRAEAAGRVDPRVPALELDRARRLALHLPRGHSRSCRCTSRRSARWSSATAC